jgi:CBS domain-containing protein
MHASSVTDKDIERITPDTEIRTILKTVGQPGPTMLCVEENGKLVGIITKADLLPLVNCQKKIRDIMNKRILTVSPDDRVIHARRIMIDENIARLPVVDDGNLVGMISDNEIAFSLADIKKSFPLGRQKHQLDELLVKDVMKIPVISIEPNLTCKQVANLMTQKNVGALPVLENDKLIGIISRTDLLRTILI